MKRTWTKTPAILLVLILGIAGCDAADIVFASLDLAGAIVSAVN